MAAAGVRMRTPQEWIGDAEIKTTLIYAHYAPSPNEAAMTNSATDDN
jgi:site-specific recombinase XerD